MASVVLASTSPQRKALMHQLGIEFEIVEPDYEEVMDATVAPHQLAIDLAFGKAMSVSAHRPDAIVIGADTFVAFEGQLLGKPHTPAKAIEMLTMLSGKKNTAFSGWAVVQGNHVQTGVVTTDIYMRKLDGDEISAYVATGEPLNKAGACAVTGKGAVLIDHIDGSIDATIGLPLTPIYQCLRDFGLEVF